MYLGAGSIYLGPSPNVGNASRKKKIFEIQPDTALMAAQENSLVTVRYCKVSCGTQRR